MTRRPERTVCLTHIVWHAWLILCITHVSAFAQGVIEGDPSNRSDYPVPQAATTQPPTTPLALKDRITGVLPYVRLTPRDVSVHRLPDSRIQLAGQWGFARDVPEGFDGDAASIDNWQPITVPGHPALQGLGKMHKEMGVPVAYRRTFTVPDHWRGHRVVLRFEGIDGLTRLWINGQPAGENEIATLPSEFDITDHIRFGLSNQLLLTIEKTLTTYWSRRELGGINRPVYLQALPTVNLARLHVDTDLSDDLRHATANAHLRIANQSDRTVTGLRVRFTIRDEAGTQLALQHIDEPIILPDAAPGQTLQATVPLPLADTPSLWTAETPNLYTLTCELLQNDQPLMMARQRFGFREVAVQGNQILINGSPVRLRGTNYHITYPGMGEIVPRDLIRRDIELFQQANFNCLRSRPTPAYSYIELCDQMGMYTTVEAMVSIMMYDKGPLGDHGNNPSMARAYHHHVATMIESYYSNPSVILWGLGNECSYWDYFKVAAVGMHTQDATRPLFFGSDGREGVGIPLMDVNDDHYPRGPHTRKNPYATASLDRIGPVTDPAWDYPDDRPQIFTEWLHVHTNNWKEVAFDPGIDDFWAYYAEIHTRSLFGIPQFAGGFQFKGAPYRGIGANTRWRGIFDDQRRINDLFWHVKKSHSPVKIKDTLGRVDNGKIVFELENRYDFTNLASLDFAWSQAGRTGVVHPDVPPHTVGRLHIDADPNSPEPIILEVRDNARHNTVVDRYRLYAITPDNPQLDVNDDHVPYAVQRRDGRLLISRGDTTISVNLDTGLIDSASVAGQTVINGQPALAVVPAQLHNFKWQEALTLVNQCADWQANDVKIDESDQIIKITAVGQYTQADVTFVTTFNSDGSIQIAYDATWTGDRPFNVFTYGIQIPVAPELDELFWQRQAFWSDYPDSHIGRPTGTAPALGDPRFAQARQTYSTGPKPWPWSQDLVAGVTRDFRSTKFNLITGGLRADSGAGILILAQPRQHLQAIPAGDDLDGQLEVHSMHGPTPPGFHLRVHDFHNGGTEPHLTKSIRFPEQIAGPGWQCRGGAVFRFVSNDRPHP